MAGRPRAFTINLSLEDRNLLEEITRSRSESITRIQRAKTLLMSVDGNSNKDIAKKLGLSTPTVCKTLKKCSLFGVEAALDDLLRSGRPTVIDLPAKSWVVSLACHLPQEYADAPKSQLWSIAGLTQYIRTHCEKEGHLSLKNVGTTTVWTILNDREIKPHRIQYYLEKKDPEFAEKAKEVLLLYKRVHWVLKMTEGAVANGQRADGLCGEVFISYDEKPGIQAIKNIAPDLAPTLKHGTVRRDYEYRRLGTVSLLAGIDLLTGEVTGLVRDTHKSADFIDFLKTVDDKYDKNCRINIILDNHSIHRSKEVMDYLAGRPNRFAFTFTPRHASWLNLIESFFSKLARQSLRGLRVKSKEELVAHIMDWIQQTNEDPVIYRWKWKLEDIQGAFS